MAYSVIGGDGKEYGPVEVAELKAWLAEGRISLESPVKDFMSSRVVSLAEIPGVVEQTPAPAPTYAAPVPPQYTGYTRPTSASGSDESITPFLLVLGRCALALGLFFVFHGIGLIIGAYALFAAIRLKSDESKYGIAAIVSAAITLLIIGAGWAMRLKTGS